MSALDSIEIRRGLPTELRLQAAILYEEAFRQKFEPIVRSQEDRLAILSQSFRPDLAFVAMEGRSIVGLVGFHEGGQGFTSGGSVRGILRRLGWFKGIRALLLFSLFERRARTGELLMDGIAVAGSMRGRGVGTRLLQRVAQYAGERGDRTVRLDVVDTNRRARRLYERLGFEAVRTTRFPLFRRLGFSASTTMVRRLTFP